LPADNTKCSFADLPGELRNQIYELSLTLGNSEPVRIKIGSTVGKELALGLLGTCKAVRKESAGVYYTSDGGTCLIAFPRMIHPSALARSQSNDK